MSGIGGNCINMSGTSNIQKIGKYEIVGILGRGSMGIVYKAKDPEIGRVVALKTLRKISMPQYHDTSTQLERFKLEARSAGNLRHPNIITIFDVNVEGDVPYIVMDYLEGEGLDQMVQKRGRIPPAEALHYIGEAAAGLDYAHSRGVVHRDVKPSNILVDRSGRVYLLDFGIASMNESISDASDAKDQPIMGTPGYMSPEQILNEKLDARSDNFSLAVVAFECIGGKRPFVGENFTQVVSSILNSKPISLSSLVPELPLALEAEFEKALARGRDERYSSALEMVENLKRALGPSFQVANPGSPPKSLRRKRVSTWKSLTSLDPKKEKAFHATEPAKDQPEYHPVWNPDRAGTPQNIGEGGYVDRFGSDTRDVLARNAQTLSGSISAMRQPLTPLRAAIWLFSFACIFLSGYLFWTLKGSISPQSPGVVAVSHEASNSPSETIADNIEVPNYDLPPKGKTAEEMTDKEVLGVLMSRESPEALVVSAIKQALMRKIPGFIGASAIALQSDSYLVRGEAIKALGEFGDKRIVPRLVLSLDDYDPLVRGQAARALGKLGSRSAIGYLSARAVKEELPEVRELIKAAIDKINGIDISVR